MEIAKAYPHTNGIYLAYNKAIAVESSKKFPATITCSTTHSLAYQNTVRPFNLRVGFFSYRDIQNRISFEEKILVIESIKDYCLSKFINIKDYISDRRINDKVGKVIIKYLGLMKNGTIDSTHDFYLKYYHLLLANGTITHENFDIVMLDEAGDLNEVTLEIFKLLPATKKIMVGDDKQNIFQFNKTINGFKVMAGHGTDMVLSKSFRVSKQIANSIQFSRQGFLDPNMKFEGMDYSEEQLANIKTTAFISRTNSTLINEMIKLNDRNEDYGLTRKAKVIFELPLGIISLKANGMIKIPQYKFLEHDYNDYYGSPSLQESKSFYGYLGEVYAEDVAIKTAIALIAKHGPRVIINTFESAKSHEGKANHHILTSSHASKGLEFDAVYIADDFNKPLQKLITSREFQEGGIDALAPEDASHFYNYYVACSRCLYKLSNAKALSWTPDTKFNSDGDPMDEEFDTQMDRFLTKDAKDYMPEH